MADITISLSPGPDGPLYTNITATGKPDELDEMIKAVDRLSKQYPVPPPKETRTAFPTDR